MITRELISLKAVQYHTLGLNIAREYVQHIFLSAFYKQDNSDRVLFKGGTALRIIYKSPRFSEDLDFSSYSLDARQIESLFLSALNELEKIGLTINLSSKSAGTTGGYFGLAEFTLYEHHITLEINANERQGTPVPGEYKFIAADFAPNYSLQMLPERELVNEKIRALVDRKKPRDFYDLYFMLRSGLILSSEREQLSGVLPIIQDTAIDFRKELSTFLPVDNHDVIRNFRENLITEVKRNIGVT